jgi:hypothetical protein
MSMSYADIAAYQALTQRASASATATYNSAMAAGAGEDRALAQAKFEWQKKMDEATQTGKWNGQWNNPQEQWYTGQFGQWYGAGGEPGVGTQTLEAQKTQGQLAQDWTQMFGQYYAPGTAPAQGQQTFDAQQAAIAQANQLAATYGSYYAPGQTPGAGTQTQSAQQQAFAQQMAQQQYYSNLAQQQQTNTQGYLGILANLRGPADWAKYQQVLGSTPGGYRDLYAAAMGQYVPGGGATTGVQPQAASLQTMMQQIAGQGGYGQQGAQPTWGGDQIGGQMQNPTWQSGQYGQAGIGGAGDEVWGSGTGIGIGQQGMTPGQAQQAAGGGTNMGGAYNMPAPNQISPQSWNNFTPTQKQLMLGNYEAGGWDKSDVEALMSQSLPKYATNSSSAGTWNLR